MIKRILYLIEIPSFDGNGGTSIRKMPRSLSDEIHKESCCDNVFIVGCTVMYCIIWMIKKVSILCNSECKKREVSVIVRSECDSEKLV